MKLQIKNQLQDNYFKLRSSMKSYIQVLLRQSGYKITQNTYLNSKKCTGFRPYYSLHSGMQEDIRCIPQQCFKFQSQFNAGSWIRPEILDKINQMFSVNSIEFMTIKVIKLDNFCFYKVICHFIVFKQEIRFVVIR